MNRTRITRRGWVVIWLAFFAIMWLIGDAVGAWDISEICAVEGVGCPSDLNK